MEPLPIALFKLIELPDEPRPGIPAGWRNIPGPACWIAQDEHSGQFVRRPGFRTGVKIDTEGKIFSLGK